MKNRYLLSGISLLSLFALTACDTQYMREQIFATRPDQVVDGGRRQPAMNAQKAGMPTAPVASTPYQTYDSNGKRTSDDASEEKHGLLDGFFSDKKNIAPAPSDNMRKQLPGNPYYSQDTSANAPVQMPSVIDRVGNNLSGGRDEGQPYPKLSSVPAKPAQFGKVKKSRDQNLSELETDHAVAQQDRGYLDREAGAPAAVIPPASSSLVPLTPSVAPRNVESLPPVNVSPTPMNVPPMQVATPYDQSEQGLMQPAEAAPLPSTDVIKTLRPSRYEERNRQYNTNAY